MTPAIASNAALIVELVNKLIECAKIDGVVVPINPRTGSKLSGGWRPAALNAKTPGAAVNSRHITAQAADIYDPDGELDEWLMSDAGQAALKKIGLWMEHPAATKGWAHVQSVPPRSGRKVFYP